MTLYTSLGINQKERKSTYKRESYTLIFFTSLFIISKWPIMIMIIIRNQPSCPTNNDLDKENMGKGSQMVTGTQKQRV
jgi:hypothetical protein